LTKQTETGHVSAYDYDFRANFEWDKTTKQRGLACGWGHLNLNTAGEVKRHPYGIKIKFNSTTKTPVTVFILHPSVATTLNFVVIAPQVAEPL